MRIIGIDTSTMVGSVALVNDGRLEGEYTLNVRRTHSERMMPALVRVMEDAGISASQIDGVAVAIGPGSFTGIRIGVAGAKGLAYTLSKPVIGISTLDALAFGMSLAATLICPVLDAKRGQVYTAIYQGAGRPDSPPRRLTEYLAVDIEEVLGKLVELGGEVVLLGDGVEPNLPKIQDLLGERARIVPHTVGTMRAGWVAQLGMARLADGVLDDPLSLLPLYVRPPEVDRIKADRLKRGAIP
ncbi:MAG: tRNA (adenosine(37)-N6)-threonylcarbamoyltransferase complex dimerization subunit type 1 TsaB [Firmicutes bacterium]|nr:tRNA (adenosine(37)-N6)-threonylcarbamoyltransferase complex dimerization subunit type 1 TsaB [Bacillota bacterium]